MSVRNRLVPTVVLAAVGVVAGPCVSAAADFTSPPPSLLLRATHHLVLDVHNRPLRGDDPAHR